MDEQNSGKGKPQRLFDLEERLHSYYGPPMGEQHLAASSWEKLQLQLIVQGDARRKWRRRLRRLFSRRISRAEVPAFLLDRLAYVAYEAHLPYRPAMLRCRFYSPSQVQEPGVHSFWLGQPYIQLLLSMDSTATMKLVEQDVLLATGLARAIGTREAKHMLVRLALAVIVVIAGFTAIFSLIGHLPLIGFPIALMLCTGALWLWSVLTRSIAFHADELAVRWLGREQVCDALHAWAERSRSPGHKRWGEPSLVERIARVCGTRVESSEKQATISR